MLGVSSLFVPGAIDRESSSHRLGRAARYPPSSFGAQSRPRADRGPGPRRGRVGTVPANAPVAGSPGWSVPPPPPTVPAPWSVSPACCRKRPGTATSCLRWSRSDPGCGRSPSPFPANPLRYVLVYAFELDSGVAIVDAGWNTDDAWTALTNGLTEAGGSITDVRAVLVTHIHPDHYGLAGRVREESGAWIGLHPDDAEMLQSRYIDTDDLLARMRVFLEDAGVPALKLPDLNMASMMIRDQVMMAEPDVMFEDGRIVDVPGWDLQTVWTPGHSPGHVCFYSDRHKLLLSGRPRVAPHHPEHRRPYPAVPQPSGRVPRIAAEGPQPGRGRGAPGPRVPLRRPPRPARRHHHPSRRPPGRDREGSSSRTPDRRRGTSPWVSPGPVRGTRSPTTCRGRPWARRWPTSCCSKSIRRVRREGEMPARYFLSRHRLSDLGRRAVADLGAQRGGPDAARPWRAETRRQVGQRLEGSVVSVNSPLARRMPGFDARHATRRARRTRVGPPPSSSSLWPPSSSVFFGPAPTHHRHPPPAVGRPHPLPGWSPRWPPWRLGAPISRTVVVARRRRPEQPVGHPRGGHHGWGHGVGGLRSRRDQRDPDPGGRPDDHPRRRRRRRARRPGRRLRRNPRLGIGVGVGVGAGPAPGRPGPVRGGTVVPESTVARIPAPAPRRRRRPSPPGPTTYLVGGTRRPVPIRTSCPRPTAGISPRWPRCRCRCDFPAVAVARGQALRLRGRRPPRAPTPADPVDTIQVVNLRTHKVTRRAATSRSR